MHVIYLQPNREYHPLWTQLDAMFNPRLTTRNNLVKYQQTQRRIQAPVALENTENALIVQMQLPGVEAKDVDVQVTQQAVQITANYKQSSSAIYNEIYYGEIQRVIELPAPVVQEEVKGTLKDGILTLTLPKLTVVPPSVVKVNLLETTETAHETETENTESDKETTVAENTENDNEMTTDIWENQSAG